MRLFDKNREYRILPASLAQLRQNAASALVLCTDMPVCSHSGAVVRHTVFAMRRNGVTIRPQAIKWERYWFTSIHSLEERLFILGTQGSLEVKFMVSSETWMVHSGRVTTIRSCSSRTNQSSSLVFVDIVDGLSEFAKQIGHLVKINLSASQWLLPWARFHHLVRFIFFSDVRLRRDLSVLAIRRDFFGCKICETNGKSRDTSWNERLSPSIIYRSRHMTLCQCSMPLIWANETRDILTTISGEIGRRRLPHTHSGALHSKYSIIVRHHRKMFSLCHWIFDRPVARFDSSARNRG